MRNNSSITVLMVEPHRHPYLKTVEHTLENLQALVGGYIEATYPCKADLVALVCDEDGLSKPEQEWNRYIDDYHFIRGRFFICGLGEEDFCDIPADLAQKYAEIFWCPESFIMADGQLVVIREDDGSAPRFSRNRCTSYRRVIANYTCRLRFRGNIHSPKGKTKQGGTPP